MNPGSVPQSGPVPAAGIWLPAPAGRASGQPSDTIGSRVSCGFPAATSFTRVVEAVDTKVQRRVSLRARRDRTSCSLPASYASSAESMAAWGVEGEEAGPTQHDAQCRAPARRMRPSAAAADPCRSMLSHRLLDSRRGVSEVLGFCPSCAATEKQRDKRSRFE